jgi:hypothetical protein
MRGSMTISEATNKSQRNYAACFNSIVQRMPSVFLNPSDDLQYDVKVRSVKRKREIFSGVASVAVKRLTHLMMLLPLS